MTINKNVTATFDKKDQTPPPSFTLTVSTTGGTGEGTVTSAPSGINCGSDCSESYSSGTVVTLTATAKAGSIFDGWSGAPDCSDGVVTLDADKTCTASFTAAAPTTFLLSVTKTGTGTGTVTSSPAGIDCGSDCSQGYNSGTQVTLTATPADDSTFEGWSGDCMGTGSCMVTMDKEKTVTAMFTKTAVELTGTWEGPYTLTQDMPICGTVTHQGTLTVVFLESGGNVTGDFTVTGVKNVTPGNCSVPGTHEEMGMNVPVTVTGNRITAEILEILGLVFDGTIEGTTLKGTLKEPLFNSDGTFELTKKP